MVVKPQPSRLTSFRPNSPYEVFSLMALDDQMRHMVNFYLILKFAIDYQNHA